MAKRIITISREFGSGGRFIGEEVAKQLGIKYYDKDIIVQIAEQSGFQRNILKKRQNCLRRKDCLPMRLQDVTSPENPWKIWCMKRREK